MNPYLIFVLAVLIGGLVLDLVVNRLNLQHASLDLPAEFADVYDSERYRRSQEYLRVRTRFGMLVGTLSQAGLVAFILVGGFGWFNRFARGFGLGHIGSGLLFAGSLLLCADLLGIPLAAYRTFVIEERFGFNRTTVHTFVLDILKGWLLAAVLGGPLFTLVLWLFETTAQAWLLAWGAVLAFGFVMAFVAPVLILPLFSKFTVLPAGELRQAIEGYTAAQDLRMRGVFTMDGSKRSAKANAFFTGFGRFRRIVLFDTLVEKHPVDEVVAVLAHEVGHYRKGHIWIGMLVSALTTGLVFFLASLFIDNRGLFDAFGVAQLSVYASLTFFGFLYAPIGTVLGLAGNWLSRLHERQADRFVVETTGQATAFISALKRLSADNLANLTPHPLHVFLHYSHPPVLARVRLLRNQAVGASSQQSSHA